VSTPLATAELAELLHHTKPDHPQAVGITATDRHLELAVRALDPDEPGLALIGFSAPQHWDAFAITAMGTITGTRADEAGGTDQTDEADEADGATVEIVHLVTRDGRERSDVRGAGPPARVVSLWVTDVCRRVLGLPTPPPATTTADLLASWWLDAIIGLIIGADLGEPSPDWSRCRALLGELGHRPLAPLGARIAREYPWPIVRRWATRRPLCGVPCPTAAWFDDGSFARYVVGGYGPIDELRADVEELLAPSTAKQLAAVLDQWPLGARQ